MKVVRHKCGITLKEVIQDLKNEKTIDIYYTEQPETLPIFGYRSGDGKEIDAYFLNTDSEFFDPDNFFVVFFLTREHYQIVEQEHKQRCTPDW